MRKVIKRGWQRQNDDTTAKIKGMRKSDGNSVANDEDDEGSLYQRFPNTFARCSTLRL
jgi:hypothetical protein